MSEAAKLAVTIEQQEMRGERIFHLTLSGAGGTAKETFHAESYLRLYLKCIKAVCTATGIKVAIPEVPPPPDPILACED